MVREPLLHVDQYTFDVVRSNTILILILGPGYTIQTAICAFCSEIRGLLFLAISFSIFLFETMPISPFGKYFLA